MNRSKVVPIDVKAISLRDPEKERSTEETHEMILFRYDPPATVIEVTISC